jgi:hypothetical protein
MLAVYLITAIGIPVYMHYCGGELEQVSFLVESDSCCGEEEEDMDPGCCANENTFARYAPDFTAKKINVGVDFVVPSFNLIYSELFQISISNKEISSQLAEFLFPPPKLYQDNIVSVSNLRI